MVFGYRSHVGNGVRPVPVNPVLHPALGVVVRILLEVVDVEDDIRMAFEFFKNQFEIDERKYQTKVMVNNENGRKGGNPNFKKGKPNPYYIKDNAKITEDNPTLPKITEDNPINVNDNVNDIIPPSNPPYGGGEEDGERPGKQKELEAKEAELRAKEQELIKREAALKSGKRNALPPTDFVSPEFVPVFTTWLEYKRERRESYKSDKSLRAAYNKLLQLSGNDPQKAASIVEQSMANNWAGLFELKEPKHGANTGVILTDNSPEKYRKEDAW